MENSNKSQSSTESVSNSTVEAQQTTDNNDIKIKEISNKEELYSYFKEEYGNNVTLDNIVKSIYKKRPSLKLVKYNSMLCVNKYNLTLTDQQKLEEILEKSNCKQWCLPHQLFEELQI